jgi:hypothetical protein
MLQTDTTSLLPYRALRIEQWRSYRMLQTDTNSLLPYRALRNEQWRSYSLCFGAHEARNHNGRP